MSRRWELATAEQRACLAIGVGTLLWGAVGLGATGGIRPLLTEGTEFGAFRFAPLPSLGHLAAAGLLLAGARSAELGRAAVALAGTLLALLGLAGLAIPGVVGLNAASAALTLVVAAALLDVAAASVLARRRDGLMPAGSIASIRREPEPEVTVRLEELTRAELYNIAREMDVPGRSRMRKRELVAALERAA